MKTFAALALAAIFGISSVAAAPLNAQNNVVQKRDSNGDVVWVTVKDLIVETVDITTTIWVTPGQPIPTPHAQAPAPADPKPSPAHAADQPVAPAPQPKPAVQSTSTTAAPVAKQSPPPPPPASSTPAAPPAQQSTSPAPSTGGSFLSGSFSSLLPGASETWQCTSSSPCGTPNDASAQASFYSMDAAGVKGIGSCGQNHDSLSEDFVAIDASIMGSLSSGVPMNPLCGKTVTVTNTENGKSASGTVVDTCPGCKTKFGIDLSQHLFDQLASESEGIFHVKWYFNGA